MSDKEPSSCQVIRMFCSTRCTNSIREVAKCTNTGCPLFSRRMGHDPNRKGIGRVKAQKSILGKYKPSQDGMKKVNIKAYSQAGKLRIILPSGDELTVKQKEEI